MWGPALTEEELRRRLRVFRQCCEYVGGSHIYGPHVADVLDQEVQPYGRHVRDCLQVYLDGTRTGRWPRRQYAFPAEPSTASIKRT